MDKQLSIVTINLNNASGLRRTASSICNLNTKTVQIEWIVVDGGSTDESLAVIDEYKNFIDDLTSEKDYGIFNAMNKGLSKAKGRYVVFMNAGDCFVERLLTSSFLKGLDGDIFYGDIYLLSGQKKVLQKQTDYPDLLYMMGKTLCHQSVFMKTDLCKKYPFSEEYSLMGDWIQLFTILKNEKPLVVYKPMPVCIYDTEGISNTHTVLRKAQRESFLKLTYSSWEMQTLSSLVRLRGRNYYSFFLKTLDSWSRQLLMKWISRIF